MVLTKLLSFLGLSFFVCPGGRCLPDRIEGRSLGNMFRACSSHLGSLGSMSPGLQAACGSRVCGSTDFPKRITQGVACGWPTARGWTPAARAYGTQHPSTSTSAPNTSKRTALNWWESGELLASQYWGLYRRSLEQLAREQADLASRVAASSHLCTSVSSSDR